jgi:hypothetical protein
MSGGRSIGALRRLSSVVASGEKGEWGESEESKLDSTKNGGTKRREMILLSRLQLFTLSNK